jgi:ABC-2 type transport system permease protein
MNTVYLGLELRRVFRDYASLFFVGVLPAFLYLIFGTQSGTEEVIGGGNVTMLIMISMAAYGAVTATTGVGGMAAVERMQGWGRQLGLTPMRDLSYAGYKAVVALAVAAIPVLLIFVLGAWTGAEATTQAWVLSGLAVLGGAAVFGFYGLAVALAFRTEAAVSAASGLLVIMAFLGNVFMPLTGTLLDVARFTPLYGYNSLARYPLTGGDLEVGGHDPLWMAIANLTVWAGIFVLAATLLVRRGRERQ